MGKVRLSEKEAVRVEVLLKVKREELSLRKGGELLGLSYRQIRRVYQRYLEGGNAGLRHGLRGRESNHRVENGRRARVLELYRTKYEDFGPTLAAEYLRAEDGEELSEETLRLWLIEAGLWEPRRRGSPHRKWRERRGHWGELVQMDGSEHDWFEGRRGKASLMVMIDDATNWTYAQFFEGETTSAAMTVFWEYVEGYGLPRALYVDRDSIYKTTRDSTVDEALSGAGPLTQFGRAMKELGVELILAHSPQAKGRVERRNGVFQDRLVKGMRLKGIETLEAANRYLGEEFLEKLNQQFSVEARESADLHRRVPRGLKLGDVLSFQEERMVQNDWTISWCNRVFQLDARHQRLSLVRRKVLVSERLDGTIRVSFGGRDLVWLELPARPQPRRESRSKKGVGKRGYKPAADHPWRGKRKGK